MKQISEVFTPDDIYRSFILNPIQKSKRRTVKLLYQPVFGARSASEVVPWRLP